jgi:hypothetical protein
MKTLLLILSIATFASCSTAYKSGQTPDDLYYSKPKVAVEQTVREDRNAGRYEEDYQDRQIRMAIRNQRWRSLDYDNDYNCNYSPYNYGYNYGYYYNPYYYPYPVYNSTVKFVNPKNTTIRTTNLGTYNNTVTTYNSTKAGTIKTTTSRRYYDSNNNTPTRRASSDNRTYTETRTYNPAPSNSSSGSSSSSSAPQSTGTPVARPGRGG